MDETTLKRLFAEVVEEVVAKRLDELIQRLEKPLPESAGTKEAARLLGICEKTLKDMRPQMVRGIHYKEVSPRKILWNPRLIADGRNTGFKSAAHLRACEVFAKAQPSNQRRRKA